MRAAAPTLLALLLAACGGGGGGGAPPSRPSPEVVASVSPVHGALEVPLDSVIVVTFRTAMDDAPLTGGALLLTFAGLSSPVDADVEVAPSRTTALVRPRNPLAANRDYQVRLSALARRADGREIGRPWYSNFRTEGAGPPPPPPPPSQGGSVVGVGSLFTGRSGHAAVALPDGRVAVFGGYDTSFSVTASIEIFDPGTELWTASPGFLGTARARCSATLLADGRVLVAGGETASTTDVGLGSFEIWNPATNSVVATGSLVERRTRHRAVRLADGRVLLAGGSRTDGPGLPNYSRSSAEVFDPGTGTCSPVSSMAVTRAGHEATLLADGRVLLTGGHGTNPSAEVFDPLTNGFTGAGTMAEPRRDHTATLLADGSVLVAGGGTSSTDRWIPANLSFYPMQNLGDVRSLAAAVRIGNGRVAVIGGEKPTAGGGAFFHATIDFYDPPTGSYLFPDIRTRTPRTGHTATPLPGGDVLVVGGKNGILGQPALRSCDRLRPQ